MSTPPPEFQGNRELPQPPIAGPAYTAYNQPGYDDPIPAPPQHYGQPFYGPSYEQFAPYQHAPKMGVNGFAVASLVLSFCGMLLLSYIFGFVALHQINRSGQSGRGYAVTGLLISTLWIVGLASAYFYAQYEESKQSLTGQLTNEQTVGLADLKTGDCVKSLQGSGVLFSVTLVPCALAHEGEVAGQFTLSGATYPGEPGLESQAMTQCESIVRQYTSPATLAKVSEIYYIGPREADWNKGRKTVLCLAMTNANQTGSVKG